MLDCVVFGKVAGDKAAKFAEVATQQETTKDSFNHLWRENRRRVEAFQKGNGTEEPAALRDEVRLILTQKVGMFRSGSDLEEALKQIRG